MVITVYIRSLHFLTKTLTKSLLYNTFRAPLGKTESTTKEFLSGLIIEAYSLLSTAGLKKVGKCTAIILLH